jgi:hypothetical protein
MKKYLYACLILFSVLIFNSCENGVGISTLDNYVIGSNPKTIQINIDPHLLNPENSPVYSVYCSDLPLAGCALTRLKYFYPEYRYIEPGHIEPGPLYTYSVQREFKVLSGDSVKVKINNCNYNSYWMIDDGTINYSGPRNWTNNDIKLIRTEKTFNNDSTINYEFTFTTLKEGKGYISFIERSDDWLGIDCSKSHGLLIGYTIKPLDKVILNIGEINWSYNTVGFSNLKVRLKGTSNVYRLRIMTFGDGIPVGIEIPIQNDNSFDFETTLAFSYQEGIIFKTNSELILYGTVGLPIVVTLINPENKN